MRQLPLLWFGVFRVSVILIALDYLKSYAFSLSNNPTLPLQQRYASLLSKKSLNLHQFSRSAQFQCSAISQNFVILGGSGDLATTKIIPGLFDLCKQYSTLSKSTNPEKSTQSTQAVVSSSGFNYDDFSVKLAARSDWSDEFLKNKLRNILSPNTKKPSSKNSLHEQLVTEFLEKCSYTCVEAYDTNALSLLLNRRNENENKNDNENENVNGNETENRNEDKNESIGEGKNVRNIVYFALPPKQYLPALNAIKNIQNKEVQDIDKNNDINKALQTKTTEVMNIKNECEKKKNEMQNLIEIVLEKPIGYDTETAVEITDLALSAVKNREENIWCVDHYIAKDLAVAILPLKTSKIPSISRLFNEYWNDDYISDVNIVFSDTGILDGRSGYFDECGITRDILQNHLIQLLALVCADIDVISTLNHSIDYSKEEEKREISIKNNDMKNGKNINDNNNEKINSSNNIKNSNNNDINWLNLKNNERSNLISEMRCKVLHSIPPLLPSDLILGQYDSYSSEKGVSINTKTSTFSSCEIQVPGPIWENTTFTLLAGKGLDKKESIIKMSYREKHFSAVRTAVRAIEKEYFIAREDVVEIQDKDLESLILVLQIQPSPGIYIEEESYPISSNNDNKPKTVKVRRLLLSMESLPYWPEDSDIIRPIPANIVTDRVEIKQEKEGDDNNNNSKANVRSLEAYTRVIESVLFNKSKKELFPSIKEVLLQWKIYGNALKIVENSIHNAGNNDSDSDDDNEYKRIIEKEMEKNKERDKDSEKNKEKEKDKRTQISKRREEQDEEKELNNNNNNSNNSGSIGLLNRIDEIVDIKKNVLVPNKDKNKDKNKDGNEEKEECDVVSKVVQEQVSTLRFYTVGSSIESIMKNN